MATTWLLPCYMRETHEHAVLLRPDNLLNPDHKAAVFAAGASCAWHEGQC